MALTRADFEVVLDGIIDNARRLGLRHVDVCSGDLHRQVGVYPDRDHRMPVCCRVMRSRMRDLDRVLQEPPSGQGATVLIRYVFGSAQ